MRYRHPVVYAVLLVSWYCVVGLGILAVAYMTTSQ